MTSCKDEFVELGFAKVDSSRLRRRGISEVVFSETKTPAQLKKIISALRKKHQPVFLSRLERKKFNQLKKSFKHLKNFPDARLGFLGKAYSSTGKRICLVTAGTSDIPVAEEAGVFLELLGNRVDRIYDAGVSGAHRIISLKGSLDKAKAVIVFAGMEGALSSLVSGVTRRPVIGVPTSIGYGANFQGLSALLGMLNGCSLGVGVVNIDNGIGAGYLAHCIANND